MTSSTKVIALLLILFSLIFPQNEPLRYYADQIGLNIGVAIKEDYILNNNQTHNNLVKREFNTIVCENSMKAENVAPSRNGYNFSVPDRVVEFGLDNNMQVRGHTLVWFSQNPQWLSQGTRETLLAAMKYHIETVMNHYKGKIFQWDVVNEPFDNDGGEYRDSPWYDIIGEDYIDSAFTYAHRVDPDCKLFLNDYNNSYITHKSTVMYDKVKKMVENGIPIDGVGFQCHERSEKKAPDLYDKVRSNFERFADLGLEIAITEIDIRQWDSTLAVQGAVYGTFMQVALDMPAVTTYMIWGVRDQDSWTGADQNALLFDNDFDPKPAYDTLKTLLFKKQQATDVRIPYAIFNAGKKYSNHPLNGNGFGRVELFDLRGVRINRSDYVRKNYTMSLADNILIYRNGKEISRIISCWK